VVLLTATVGLAKTTARKRKEWRVPRHRNATQQETRVRHRAIKPAAGTALLVVGLTAVWASGAGSASAKRPAAAGRAAGSAPTAYVPNGGDPGMGAVFPISTATNTAGKPIKVGSSPDAIAITPDGRTAYVVGSLPSRVVPISTATNTAGTAIMLPKTFFGLVIAVTPDGKTAYVTGNGKIGTHGKVVPISTATNTAGKVIETTGDMAYAIAFTPGKQTAYVACLGGAASHIPPGVTPINTATNTAGKPILVGPAPAAIAITP
jgi:DNA-binding beta-propeller fold protein YncE